MLALRRTKCPCVGGRLALCRTKCPSSLCTHTHTPSLATTLCVSSHACGVLISGEDGACTCFLEGVLVISGEDGACTCSMGCPGHSVDRSAATSPLDKSKAPQGQEDSILERKAT